MLYSIIATHVPIPHLVRSRFMRLAFDVSRCANTECVLAQTCARMQVPGRPGNQVFSIFPGGNDCPAYIDMRKNT